jgi:predicted negative regulator of RcsB-dependent stress response
MSRVKKTYGFAALEALLLLVLVAIVAFTGYKVYKDRNNTNKLNEQSASQQVAVPKSTSSSTSGVPANIGSTSDLNQASQTLNSDNPDDNAADITGLNSQTSF